MKSESPARIRHRPSRPLDRDKAVSAAYLRLIGETQQIAAEAAGVGYRTLCSWEAADWWPEIQLEARQRWLRGLEAGAMVGLSRALLDPDEYAQTSRWVADRIIPELARAGRTELSGPNGGPMHVVDWSALIENGKVIDARLDEAEEEKGSTAEETTEAATTAA